MKAYELINLLTDCDPDTDIHLETSRETEPLGHVHETVSAIYLVSRADEPDPEPPATEPS